MRNEWVGVVLACAIGAEPAWAGDATVGTLSKIQGETLVLKARTARAAAQAELNMRLRDSGALVEPGIDELPVVRSVYGARGTMVANLLFVNGTTREVKVGDDVRGGFKVVKISVERVDLSRGSGKTAQTYTLGFSSTPPTSTLGSPPGLPPPLPGAGAR